MATWAEAALPAGEGDEHLMVTIFATNSSKAEVEVTASEEFAYNLANDRSPMTVAILIMLSVNSLELRKMALDEFVEGRLPRLARLVDFCDLRRQADHGNVAFRFEEEWK
jgi:hypothetical protein